MNTYIHSKSNRELFEVVSHKAKYEIAESISQSNSQGGFTHIGTKNARLKQARKTTIRNSNDSEYFSKLMEKQKINA